MSRSGGTIEDLAGRIADEMRRRCAEPLGAGLHVVATPIGNLGDIGIRALATLARADLICCEDTRHSRTLLAHYAISRPLKALHEHNEEAEVAAIVARIAAGQAVALITDAGTPLVSDPGFRLVRAVAAAGLPVLAVPGASALLAALTVSGLPADSVLFAGFLPPKETARRERLSSLVHVPATLVFFEAPGRVAALIADLGIMFGDRQLVLARELTKRFEEVRRGLPSELLAGLGVDEAALKGECVVLVAPPAERLTTDADIERALQDALASQSLRDAVRGVAEDLGVARSRAYEIGLRLKGAAP